MSSLDDFNATVFLKKLQKKHSLEDLAEMNELTGNPLCYEEAKKLDPEITEPQIDELIETLNAKLYEKFSCGSTRAFVEMKTELPPASLVKKMLGRTEANNFRFLLEEAEELNIGLNLRDPYPLVNKNRLRRIIAELAEFVSSQRGF